MPSLVGGLGPGPPKMGPTRIFCRGRGEQNSRRHCIGERRRCEVVALQARGGYLGRGYPPPQQVFSTPQPTRVWRSILRRGGAKIEASQVPSGSGPWGGVIFLPSVGIPLVNEIFTTTKFHEILYIYACVFTKRSV